MNDCKQSAFVFESINYYYSDQKEDSDLDEDHILFQTYVVKKEKSTVCGQMKNGNHRF